MEMVTEKGENMMENMMEVRMVTMKMNKLVLLMVDW